MTLIRNHHAGSTALVTLCSVISCAAPSSGPDATPSPTALTGSITSLDASGNGTVDEADSVIFDSIANGAWARLTEDQRMKLGQVLYTGPGEGGFESLFSRVGWSQAGEPEFGDSKHTDLFALAKEAAWFSQHVKLHLSEPAAKAGWGRGGSMAHNFANYDQGSMVPKAVCAGIGALALDAYQQKGVKPAAVFDLDNTVWSGHAIDPFLAALIELKILPEASNAILKRALAGLAQVDSEVLASNTVSQNAQLLLDRSRDRTLPKEARVNRKDQFFLIAEIMSGLPVEAGKKAAKHFFEVGTAEYPAWKGQIFASEEGCGMKDVLSALRRAGVEVFFISASLDVIVDAAGDYLGVDDAYRQGSPLEVRDGAYTGQVESIYSLKAPVVRAWLGAPPMLAFGDSARSDFQFMAETAGAAFMINPDDKFISKDTAKVDGRFVSLNFSSTISSLSSKNTPAVP